MSEQIMKTETRAADWDGLLEEAKRTGDLGPVAKAVGEDYQRQKRRLATTTSLLRETVFGSKSTETI